MPITKFTAGKLYRYVGVHQHRGLGEAMLCLSNAGESTTNTMQPVVFLSADGVVGQIYVDPRVWEEVK